jgi:hypothetical protein
VTTILIDCQLEFTLFSLVEQRLLEISENFDGEPASMFRMLKDINILESNVPTTNPIVSFVLLYWIER